MAEKLTLHQIWQSICAHHVFLLSIFLFYSTCLLRLQPEGGGYRHALVCLDSVVSLIGN